MASTFDELDLYERVNRPGVTWAPFFLEAVERQRLERDGATALALSHAAPREDEAALARDWAEVNRMFNEVMDELARKSGPSPSSAPPRSEEAIQMAQLSGPGGYAPSGYEEPLDRAARNRATYGYDPDEYATPAADGPPAIPADTRRDEFLERVYRENPLLTLADARHRPLGGQAGADEPRRARPARGRVDAHGVPVHEDGTPVYTVNGPLMTSTEQVEYEERRERRLRREADARTPQEISAAARRQLMI